MHRGAVYPSIRRWASSRLSEWPAASHRARYGSGPSVVPPWPLPEGGVRAGAPSCPGPDRTVGFIHRATADSRAERGEPKLAMIDGRGRKTAPGAPPERIVGVHVPMGPGSSSRASTLASFRLRRFSRPGRVAPLRGRPACFIRSRSWGLSSGGMTQRGVHVRCGPKVAPAGLPSP